MLQCQTQSARLRAIVIQFRPGIHDVEAPDRKYTTAVLAILNCFGAVVHGIACWVYEVHSLERRI